jgi:hypothetical protein
MRQQYTESYLGHKYWIASGDKVYGHPEYGNGYTYQGTITSAAAAGDWDESELDNTAVEALADAKKVIFYVPQGWVTTEFRFRYNGTAGDQHVLECFASAGKDHYRHIDQLTIDQGAQEHTAGAAGTGIHFIDTVVSAGEQWMTVTKELTTTTDNIGGWMINNHGYDRFFFVASTLDVANSGTTLYIDVKQV